MSAQYQHIITNEPTEKKFSGDEANYEENNSNITIIQFYALIFFSLISIGALLNPYPLESFEIYK